MDPKPSCLHCDSELTRVDIGWHVIHIVGRCPEDGCEYQIPLETAADTSAADYR